MTNYKPVRVASVHPHDHAKANQEPKPILSEYVKLTAGYHAIITNDGLAVGVGYV